MSKGGKEVTVPFRKELLNKCQKEFEVWMYYELLIIPSNFLQPINYKFQWNIQEADSLYFLWNWVMECYMYVAINFYYNYIS